MVKWKPLIGNILLPVAVGMTAGILTMNSTGIYETLVKPPLSPPRGVFPVVWTILYILMGISAYLIYISDSPKKKEALVVYFIQLAVNFMWSIVFFGFQDYLAAFIVLAVLWLLIFIMIIKFYMINPIAAWLQVPYLLWVTFAGYLNLMIYLLNK